MAGYQAHLVPVEKDGIGLVGQVSEPTLRLAGPRPRPGAGQPGPRPAGPLESDSPLSSRRAGAGSAGPRGCGPGVRDECCQQCEGCQCITFCLARRLTSAF